VVTALRLVLESEARQLVLDYAGVAEELARLGVTTPRPVDVANAVIRLRRRKLPEPNRLGNLGSFFKNPIVPRAQAADLARRWPALPHWAVDGERRKLSAAWLIESLGFKGLRLGDAGVYQHHALVLVNHGAARGEELLALARRIITAVEAHYGVRLEIEPDLW
jgi:UDP-N-acetylmuramate dehydrogenase